MRLLIACPDCHRQFSVAERRVGSCFHCHCGQSVEVRAARGHDASAVVCSQCGAPREEQAKACGHCSADFTLHEQDLATVCPECLARISRRARFCHHCGVRIAAEPVRKRTTPHTCPACEEAPSHLAHRRLGDRRVSVLECQACAGLWIPIGRLEAMIDEEARRERAPRGPERTAWKRQPGKLYRPCVVCSELMVRQNFGSGRSRVIVDICGHHGVWFDDEELAHVLAWVREGGAVDVRLSLAKLKGSRNRSRKPAMRQTESDAVEPPPIISGVWSTQAPLSMWGGNSLLEALTERLLEAVFPNAFRRC